MTELTQLLAILVVAGGSAFFGTYMREKGKNLATKEDLEPLVRGQETIKQQLAHSKFVERRHWDEKHEIARKLLTQLSRAQVALVAQNGWYVEPGSEYRQYGSDPAFANLSDKIGKALNAVEELTGPAELFLPTDAVEALKELAREEWHAGYTSGADRLDYVIRTLKLVKAAQEVVLRAAKSELGIPQSA